MRETEVEVFGEILNYFENKKISHRNVPGLLFEIDHAVSYLNKLRNKEIIFSGVYGMSWIDVIKLPIENLIETEFADIERVLREIRSLFSIGWAPILVHLSGTLAYNIDGTHRHYALLSVELLRRLKHKLHVPLRKINLNSKEATEIITEFSWRYKKVGLSLRETLRTVNYLINSQVEWPYLHFMEEEINKIIDTELQYIPVIYLPEWRARTVIKDLCDEGTALVGIPPINIEIVGSSNGKRAYSFAGDTMAMIDNLIPGSISFPCKKTMHKYDKIIFDCDSTLVSLEGLDELAELKGKKSEVAELTRLSMEGNVKLGRCIFS